VDLEDKKGQCKTCLIETEDIYYVFCSIECQQTWYSVKEKGMGQYDIDKDLYTKWFEDKTTTIDKMSLEEVEKRIDELRIIDFYAKRESMMLAQHADKLTGRKGLPSWVRIDRDKLITDPNIKVNWEGEPRKKEPKEKKPKEDKVKNLLGFSIKDLTQQIKDREKAAKAGNGSEKETKEETEDEKPVSLNDAISFLTSSGPIEPKEEVKKATDEEIKLKADALKEKMRLRLVKKE